MPLRPSSAPTVLGVILVCSHLAAQVVRLAEGGPQPWSGLEWATALGLEALLVLGPVLLCFAARRSAVRVVGLTLLAVLSGVANHRGWPDPGPATAPAPATPRAGPLVLLLTLDTLRKDHVSGFEGAVDAGLTTELAALVAQGRRFEAAYAPASLTLPSHTTLLSGLPVLEHGVIRNGLALPAELDSVPRRLGAAGFRTAAFVSASVLTGRSGLRAHFQQYRDALGPWAAVGRTAFGGRALARLRPSPTLVKEPGSTTVDRALRWVSTLGRDEATFLWVHLYDPHLPHGAPGERLAPTAGLDPCQWARHPSALRRGPGRPWLSSPGGPCGPPQRAHAEALHRSYQEEVRRMDHEVGRLFSALRAARGEDLRWIVVADHGESLGEHQQFAAHAWSLAEAVVAIPLVVGGPKVRPAAVYTLTSADRTARTLLDLAEVEVPTTFRGPSLLVDEPDSPSYVATSPGFHTDDSAARTMGLRFGRRDGLHKVVLDSDGHIERYDLAADPLERRPLVLPVEAEQSRARLDRSGVPPMALPEELRPERRARVALDAGWFGTVADAGALLPFATLDAQVAADRARAAELPTSSTDAAQHEALRALGYLP